MDYLPISQYGNNIFPFGNIPYIETSIPTNYQTPYIYNHIQAPQDGFMKYDLALFSSQVVHFLLTPNLVLGSTLKNLEYSISSILKQTPQLLSFQQIFTTLLYINRITIMSHQLSYSLFEIWLMCFILADISLHDYSISMKTWASIIKIPVKNLVAVYTKFLKMFNYDLFISRKSYLNFVSNLKNEFYGMKYDLKYFCFFDYFDDTILLKFKDSAHVNYQGLNFDHAGYCVSSLNQQFNHQLPTCNQQVQFFDETFLLYDNYQNNRFYQESNQYRVGRSNYQNYFFNIFTI